MTHKKALRSAPGTTKAGWANPDKIAEPASKTFNRDRAVADIVTTGLGSNAHTAILFSQGTWGQANLTEMVSSLHAQGRAVVGGDLASAECLLIAQVASLNAIYGELARRAALNIGEHLEASERYMRLALKAQGQCRATLETLAAIKNPPVVFAKQANIAHGPQQVNNGVAPPAQCNPASAAPARGENEGGQTKLLEGEKHGGMDAGATAATARGNSAMASVGAVHRPQDG